MTHFKSQHCYLDWDENNKKSGNYPDSPSNSPSFAAMTLGATDYKEPSMPLKQFFLFCFRV